jgi:sugar phosphate isomerase/epimerase
MSGAVSSFLMPFSNVAHLPLLEQLRATQLAGYQQLAMMPFEVERFVSEGISLRDIRRAADDHGIRISRLDPLNTWSRIWRPENMDDAYISRVDTVADKFFALSTALGCTHMSLNATFPFGSMRFAEIVEDFASICKRAADHGLYCDLEFIPLWGVPTLDLAWKIVEAAGESNGGIVFDVWHFVRGGSSLATLAAVPGEKIRCVQLNDGPLVLPEGATLVEDCYNRLFPGDGEFPCETIVRVLADTGGLNQVGAEVFSPMLQAMNAEQIAIKSAESTAKVLASAGVDVLNTDI